MAPNIDALRHGSRKDWVIPLQKASMVFWDFDGVIKDSVSAKADGFEQLFLCYGREVACRVRKHHEEHGGMSRFEKIPVYLGWVREPATMLQVQEFCDRFSELVVRAVLESPWVPGVREYLQKNYIRQRFVLLTATPQEEIEGILSSLNITHCFDQVCGAPTEKAAAMADALRRTNFEAKDALMIGDSESDLRAAEVNKVAFLLRCTMINQSLQQRYCGPMFEDLSQ